MNLPNKLTLFRIILIPVFVVFVLCTITPVDNIIATVVFIIASLTDLFDGKIARKRGLVTDFGKFADPLADKLLCASAFICFVQLGTMPGWVCLIIIAREFAISGFRLVVAGNGVVIAASYWGKFKTFSQMIFIGMTSLDVLNTYGAMAPGFANVFEIIRIIMMYIALALTIISMLDYFIKNRKAFNSSSK